MNGNRTFELFGGWAMLALFIVLPPAFAVAQDSRPPKVPDYGYTDSIFINGKIVSLKIGRLTDFVVLDKDFFTVSVKDIPTIELQMTVVDGVTRFLRQDLARQWKSTWQATKSFQIRFPDRKESPAGKPLG